MILKSLHLKNFRKFQNILLEFPDGVTGIIGLNGAGKSTLFEAVAWALYGPVAARTSSDQIRREGADIKDCCKVELEFIFGDDNYKVTREITGKNLTSSASIMVNGSLLATGSEIVSSYIQKKLGMDYKSFYTSIFAKQKELNALSTMKSSERRPLILRMLGINSLDSIITDIRSDIKQISQTIEQNEVEIIDNNGISKDIIFNKQLKKAQDDKKTILKDINEIKNSIKNEKQTYSTLKHQMDEHKKIYEKTQKHKDEILEKKALYEKKQQLEKNIIHIKTKVKEREDSLQIYNQKLKLFSKLNQEIIDLKKNKDTNKKILQEMVKKIEECKNKEKFAEKDIKNLSLRKNKIETLGPQAKCPTCERILNDQFETLLKFYNQEINQKQNEIKIIQKNKNELEKQFDKISKQKNALDKKQSYLHTQLIQKEKLLTQISELKKEIENEQISILNKQKDLQKIIDVKFDEKQYQSIKNNIQKTYSTYQLSIKTVNEVQKKLEKLKIRVEKIGGEKNLITQQIQQLKIKIVEQKSLKEKIEKQKRHLQNLKMLKELMISFRIHIISQIRPVLSLYASNLFEPLTDGKYSLVELDENYNIFIYDNATPYPIERFSGGEEDLANLCVRLAISEIITQQAGSLFQFIILDEIFGSQDDIRKQNIIRALNSFSLKYRQIFLITHIEEIKNFTENSVYVLEEENDISTIKMN